jgi:TolB-like protein/Flp pilus assembly protein TadD
LLFSFENFVIDCDRRELRRDARLVAVEPRVFDLLTYVIKNRDRVVSRDDLMTAVWDGRIVSESALTTCINAARSAVSDNGEAQRFIKTLPRKGIRFVGAVREDDSCTEARAVEIAREQIERELALPDRPSVAVLPFSNLSGEPEQEYFADGMAQEIITALSRCNWLFVIAHNSSFTYKGKTIDVRQVARELGVRYVLQGSVRRENNRIRFSGQLVEAMSGTHIWADRFDGEMRDIFDLQDQFTASVVAAIEPTLQLAEIGRLKGKPAASLEAYDLLLRAQQLEYEFTEESLAGAIDCLRQALTIDPRYARAMALAAYCYAERRFQGWAKDLGAEATEGLRLSTRAVELGKDDSSVLWMAAYAVRQFASDARAAKELVQRSLSLNPNSAIALAIAGWIEVVIATPADALELFRRAERLSPRDPRGWFIAGGMAHAHFTQGEFDAAVSCAKRALLYNPRYASGLRLLAAGLAKLGRRDEAAAAVQRLLRIEPELTISSLRARVMFMDESVWDKFAGGLRLAGLSE